MVKLTGKYSVHGVVFSEWFCQIKEVVVVGEKLASSDECGWEFWDMTLGLAKTTLGVSGVIRIYFEDTK